VTSQPFIPRAWYRVRAPGLALVCALAAPAAAQPAAALAPTGTLRAVFLGTNPVQGRVDARTGVASGPVPDLVRELASRFGVPHSIIPVRDAAAVIAAINSRTADIGFLAYDETRARQVDFGGAFIVMLNSYLVRADSPVARSADVDREGVTVAAVRGQSQQLFVSRHLKSASVRVLETMPRQAEIERLLAGGEVDAFAINRQRSLEAQAASGGRLRALPDSFLEVEQSFVVAKGDRGKLAIIEALVADLRASGFIRASIERAGLAGVEVASAGSGQDRSGSK
jgi:polar amino acid transport system substrate-binding protein